MSDAIVNKVAKSGLVTLNLEDLYPVGERIQYDLADNLWQGLALREKDFRSFISEHDWQAYSGKYVAIHCSVDAIIPTWAYMLLAGALQPYAKLVVHGTIEALENALFDSIIEQIKIEAYRDARVIVKGCSDKPVPTSAYLKIATRLQPVVKSLMFGEPCSTVPLYKRPKKQ